MGSYGKRKSRQRDYPVLTKEQQKLVSDNLWVADKLAKSIFYTKDCGCLSYEDLRGVGYWGMVTAATKFDKTRGAKYSTFCWSYVKGHMLHEIRDKSRVARLPRDVLDYRAQVFDLDKQKKSDQYISDLLGISIESIILCRKSWKSEAISVENQTEEMGDMLLGQIGPTDNREQAYQNDFPEEIREAVAGLSDYEIKTALRFFYEKKPLKPARLRKAQEVISKIRAVGQQYEEQLP